MNKILIVDASESDRRLMAGLLYKSGYEPIAVETMEAAKDEVEKLPPGAVIVTAMKFTRGTAQELINWQKREGYKFPVIAIVDNLNPLEIADVMKDGGAVNIVQRPAIDKQLVEVVGNYARPENTVLLLNDELIPRQSEAFRKIGQAIHTIAATNVNCIIFGECGTGKEQIARQIYLQSSRAQKPCTVIEAGGAALVGRHDPATFRSEIYNRIEGYFQKTDGVLSFLKMCICSPSRNNQMKYDECLQVLSPARLNKYAQASGNEKAKTLRLYQYNIKLSQRFYGVIGMFEIMLRNAINAHYKQYFNDDNWIINQARPNGLLEQEASEILRIQRTYTNMGVYNNDKMVASFTFGFWTYLFTRRNYRIGGKTLLQIFPNKAHGLKQTDIYKQLTAIREFRNRIAHHEPICFNATRAIDTKYAKEHYELIRTYYRIYGI